MKTILLLGPPGSGKGSVASWLVQHYNFIHLSTGQIFRALANSNDHFGQELKNVITRGEYVNDDLTNQIVKQKLTKIFLENEDACLVLDGYPRTVKQAKFLDQNFILDKVILLDCPKEEIVDRLSNRLVCKASDHSYHKIIRQPKVKNICDLDSSLLYQRKDDQQEIILKRYDLYQKEVQPLIVFYQQKNLIAKIDSSGKLETVINSLIKIMKLG